MISPIRWIERTFTFDFPVEMLPYFIERLRGTPARLDDITKNLSRDTLTFKPEGKWSIQEHIGHLYDLDELHEKRLDEFIAGAEILSPADMENRKTEAANHNTVAIDQVLFEFRSKRLHFVERLTNVDKETAARTAQHPRLQQPMRLVDMVFFTAEHDDHHIVRMIENIKCK